MNQLPEVIDDEQQQFLDLNYQFLLEYVEQAKQYGIDVSEMEARLQRIAEKKQRIAEKKQKIEEDKKKIVELDKQLEEEKASLREKFKPLDTDDEGILWAKGSTFLADKMPEEAAECFQMFTDKTAAEYRLCGQNAVRFAKTYNRLAEIGISGGVMVFLYEEGLPHQAVEIGDIIFQMDGNMINTVEDYSYLREENKTHFIRLLRFTDDGYDIVDSTLEPDRGRIGLRSLSEILARETTNQSE